MHMMVTVTVVVTAVMMVMVLSLFYISDPRLSTLCLFCLDKPQILIPMLYT